MKINIACRVEIGTMPNNDDRAVLGGRILNAGMASCEEVVPALAAVCDGCGGYAGGSLAAQTVLEILSGEPAENLTDQTCLAVSLERCQQEVLLQKEELPQFSQMCTTVAGCIFDEERTLIFHAGDSRVYRYDGFYLAKMTVDHSQVQELLSLGMLTEEEAVRSPNRNVITRCIGVSCLPPEIYISNTPIRAGEIYLICSDGLWEYLSAEDICRVLGGSDPLSDKAERLVELALSHGSSDNITACLCACQGEITFAEEERYALD